MKRWQLAQTNTVAALTPRMSTAVIFVVATLATLTALPSCSSDEGLSCGAGTRLEGGKCVLTAPVDACGPGTVRDGQTCFEATDTSTGADVGATADATVDGGADSADPADAGGDATEDAAPDATDIGEKPCDPACGQGDQCVDGVCEPLPVPEAWTCAKSAWADGQTCDCDCGDLDPDCADNKLPVDGCASGVCTSDGTCKPCLAQCSGKECGGDGCGGACGSCPSLSKPSCVAGKCVACAPSCDGKACGPDGCGGQCGDCEFGKVCTVGQCTHPPPSASCFGQCGQVTASGCACTSDCEANGNCCVNVHVCGCLPVCAGKQCGADGCGGTCGSCKAGNVCVQGACQLAVCDALTCNGHGTCEPATATCKCEGRFAEPYCDTCDEGFVDYPNCVTACTDEKACDDGNPCTQDSCEAKAGCLNLPIAATCTDGDACSVNDVCQAAKCTPGQAADCDDNNTCTVDSCDKAKGCVHVASGVKTCDDGDACTTADTCSGAECQGGPPTPCDDGNICSVDSCAPASGCVHLPSGATCADNDLCSIGSACNGTSCASLGAKSCDDGNSCTVDSCAAGSGKCNNVAAKAAAACQDGNPCTAGDSCNDKGACVAGPAICALTVSKGLQAHYSAAFPASMDFDGDGGVTRWRDLSGLGRDLVAVDTNARPKLTQGLVHGRAGVRFAGSKGLRSTPFSLGTAATVFLVVCTKSEAALGPIFGHGNTQTDLAIASLAGAATAVSAMSAGADGGLKAVLATEQCYVLTVRASSAARELLYVDATTTVGSAKGAALSAASRPLHVGTSDANAASGAIIAELLYFDRAVSDAERDDVLTYLRTAWGFAAPHPDFAWYDATDLPSLVTGTDGQVTLWRDKSGHHRDATGGKDTSPKHFASGTSNGKPAIRFDGPAVRLTTAEVATTAQITVVAVFEMDKPQPWGAVFAQGHDKYFSLRRTEDVKDHLNFHIRDNNKAPVAPMKLGEWQVWTGVQDATSTTLYQDPAKAATVSQAPIGQGQAALTIGNSAAPKTESMGGFIAEIRAFSAALNSADRHFVERLLSNKYGL